MSLDSLSAQQLTQVKKQLDEEVEHLTTSFAQLQAAQIKFKDCLRCVKLQGTTPGEILHFWAVAPKGLERKVLSQRASQDDFTESDG